MYVYPTSKFHPALILYYYSAFFDTVPAHPLYGNTFSPEHMVAVNPQQNISLLQEDPRISRYCKCRCVPGVNASGSVLVVDLKLGWRATGGSVGNRLWWSTRL